MFENTVTDEDIQSLIDGELDDSSSEYIFEAVLESPSLFQRFTYYISQREQLRIWWRAQKMEH